MNYELKKKIKRTEQIRRLEKLSKRAEELMGCIIYYEDNEEALEKFDYVSYYREEQKKLIKEYRKELDILSDMV